MNNSKLTLVSLAIAGLMGCQSASEQKQPDAELYGTQQPFAKEAIYFVMTDRFVDGDPTNNHEDQGGEYPTFQQPLVADDGRKAYVGYMGGDLKGIVNNADYIAEMGFTAVWLTPVIDNPDEAFAGGEPIEFGGAFRDGGKTGYHGYWANNFYQLDEHYPSPGLGFAEYTQALKAKGIKTVLDIVANHGSPSFTMPVDQPKFGELYDIDGNLVADHQNLKPEDLDADNPLHQFFHQVPDIMQLSNLNEDNPQVREYLIGSYLHWLKQGADAIRIDTIKHVPHSFWKETSDRLRAEYPDLFMFGESFNFDANFIAQHTLEKNGGVSVLDFPGRESMKKVFESADSDFAELGNYLHLTHGPYTNPYELVTFYDNHDMSRINASDEGFIDAHNWLFTSRGIPAVYYGSEMGFMRGTSEHAGNRNYFGQENVDIAKTHPIRKALSRIANVRKQSPALQRGLQLNLELDGNRAAFYRVVQDAAAQQTALVLLNKGDDAQEFMVKDYIQPGVWRDLVSGEVLKVEQGDGVYTQLKPHDVAVWVREGAIDNPDLLKALKPLMAYK